MGSGQQQKLRVGVIGSGAFAAACHIPGLQSHPHAEVVAIYGRNQDHTQSVAKRFGIPHVYTDYEELCRSDQLDAITIVTPNTQHARQALTALALGKHVFCEKPLALSVEEAREMLRAAEAVGKIHQVAFTYRYLYGVQELKRRLLQGNIGCPYYLRIHWESWDAMTPEYQIGFRDKLDAAGGGVLFDMGSHLSDLARFILGPIEAITGFVEFVPRQRIDGQTGMVSDVETDDIAAAWFVSDGGIRGQWFASRVTPPSDQKAYVEIVGSEGALQATLSRGTVDVLRVSSPTRPAWQELPLPSEAQDKQPHCLGIMMRSFVDACLRGKLAGDVDASFHDGLLTQQMVAAVAESSTKRTWVQL